MVDFNTLNMQEFANNPLYQKYLTALNKFLEDYLPNLEYTHVFLTGSFVTGKLTETSDLDLDIVGPDITKQVVKTIVIDGIQVEYATFSFEMIANWLSGKEYDHPDLLAKAVSNWKLVVGDNFPEELVKKAQNYKT